jgi:hypothetical protein
LRLYKLEFQHIKLGNMPIPERVIGVYLKVQYLVRP